MNRDLTDILNDWPYDPSKVNVRLIQSRDGESLIQIRLDLGILQLRYEGRPDGQTINGYPSLLEFFEARADGLEPPPDDDEEAIGENALGAKAPSGAKSPPDSKESGTERRGRSKRGGTASDSTDGGSANEPDGSSVFDGASGVDDDDDDDRPPLGGPDGERGVADHQGEGERDRLILNQEDCRALRDEAAQYYHRYVALLILEDFEGVVRDTTRNLRVLDLCARFAEAEEDRGTLEQFRPYIMMMRARALASQALRDNETKAAVVAIDEGLEALKKYYTDQEEPEAFTGSNEAAALQEMRDTLVPKLPVAPPSQAAELRQRLQHAIDQENYELAAILRDELRLIERGGGQSA